MQNRKVQRLIYHIQHRYLTMNNAVVIVAAVIAISWAWASVGVVQRNYALQREVDAKDRERQLAELQTQNLEYEQHYYQSNEYLTLQSKKLLGLAESGEKVVVLPPNSESTKQEAKQEDSGTATTTTTSSSQPTNAQQWINFLFGGSSRSAS